MMATTIPTMALVGRLVEVEAEAEELDTEVVIIEVKLVELASELSVLATAVAEEVADVVVVLLKSSFDEGEDFSIDDEEEISLSDEEEL
jgi:hypothetical protein